MQPYHWQFLILTLAAWVNRSQQDAIEYLTSPIAIWKGIHQGLEGEEFAAVVNRGKDQPTLVGDANPSPLGDGARPLS